MARSHSDSSWCTVESDPGVFTELIAEIGVKGVQVEEIYELDKKIIEELQPLHGLIFLFKWRPERDERICCECPNLFFAKQVINNACATQAILSILLNCPDTVDIGTELTQFKNFTREFPAELKGLAISNSEPIRKAHNSFARPEPFTVGEEQKPVEEDDDIYHFISYIPFNGVLYELDGLKAGPISLGECSKDDWLDKVFPIIQKRIEKYASSEIRFNLMAIIKDRKIVFNEQIKTAEQEKMEIEIKISKIGQQTEEMVIDSLQVPTTLEDLQAKQVEIDERLKVLKQQIIQEEEKLKNWKVENIRRKHNYIPFFVNLLKILAEKGELIPLIQKASRKT